MRFTKIKQKQNGQIDLAWEEANGSDVQTTELSSRDAPKPEFTDALENLRGDFVHILGLPTDEKFAERLEMTGVAISSSKNDARGFVLTAKLRAPGGGWTALNTPRVAEPAEDETADGDSRLTADQVGRIDDLAHEAARYASGERIQRQLELEGEEEAEPAEVEA